MPSPELLFNESEAPQPRGCWNLIPLTTLTDDKVRNRAHRLNALGSFYYFVKVVLRKNRLTNHLHKSICETFEQTHLQEVLEIPRDHFKSTIGSEGAPMWWALPFSDEDEDYMRRLGYGDEWIRWMRRAHDQDTRTLLVSENITNCAKLGRRIEFHYKNNGLFRGLFPEILPDTSCSWTQYSMTHKRTNTASAAHGEGTYDFIGVNAALQSRHYIRIGQDDLVGREALKSEKVMKDTIEYHQLLVGAFDSDYKIGPDSINDEYVIGNRWAYNDLNNWIKENEGFHFTTHSALGGCCEMHPPGQIIFPEEFGSEKLNSWQKRLGSYLFSCQFLNSPTLPGQTRFKEENLRYYWFETVSREDLRMKICHETVSGQVVKDIMPKNLSISLVTDPAHSENTGRCRHAITVTGFLKEPRRVYLLDSWAKACTYEEYVNKIIELAVKWNLKEINVETVAAQKYLKFHLEYRIKIMRELGKLKHNIKVNPLKSEGGEGAKAMRIESFDPYYENAQFFIRKTGHEDFILEYSRYPYAATKDILDTLGYAPQTWGHNVSEEDLKMFNRKFNSPNPYGNRINKQHVNSVTGY